MAGKLVLDVETQPGLLVKVLSIFPLGIFYGLFGLLHNMLAGFSECPKIHKAEAAHLIKHEPENWHSMTTAIY